MKEGSIRKKNIVFMLLAGIIVLVSYTAIITVCKITPFGDETFLMYDMKRQYIDYYAYAKTLFSGDNSFLYSFSTTLGSGMIGFELYYLSSPFMFVFALCPANILPLAVTIVIGIKLSIAAMIMYLFLRRNHFGDTNIVRFLLADIMSASWALSSFLFAHSMNMMWIDAIVVLPFIIWALEHMLNSYSKGQFVHGIIPYIACMACLLIFNYYIAYQVIIFLGIWTIMYLFIKEDKHVFVQIIRVITASIIAAGLDAVLLLPTALELVNSPKDLSKLGFNYNGKNLLIRDVFSKLPACSYDYIEARFGFPQIYCGVVMIFLTLLFFLWFRRDIRQRIARLVCFIILLVSFCNDKINLLWHAGMEPSGHPYRYAYMWIFLMILCSYDVAIEFYEDESYQEKGGNKKSLLGAIVRLSIAIILIGIIFYEVLRVRYDHMSQMTIKLNWLLLICYSLALLGAIVFKAIGKKGLVIVTMVTIAFAQMSEMVVNDSYTYSWQAMLNQNMSEYSMVRGSTNEAVQAVKDIDKSFYRMENLNPRQQNDAMQYNYNGITHYSSAGLIYVRYFLQRLGFNDDKLLTHYGHDNTATADSLLGVKYVLSDGNFSVHDTYESVYNGVVSAYVNPYALPVAISTSGYNYNEVSDGTNVADSGLTHVPALDPFSLQEDMYGRLLGREVKLFEPADITKTADESDMPCDIYEVTVAKDGELFMYVDGILQYMQGLSVYIGEEWFSTYGNASCYKILNLGYHNAGETLVIKLVADSYDAHLGEGIFVTELIENLEAVSKECMAKGAAIEKISSSHLKINCKQGDGLFLSIPCDAGWKIKYDGKAVTPIAIYDSLMYVPMVNALGTQDSHNVEMRYIPEGLLAGAMVSAISIIVVALIIYRIARKRRNNI